MEALYGSLPGFGSAAKNDVDAPIAFFDCIYVGTPGGDSASGSPKSPNSVMASNGANGAAPRGGAARNSRGLGEKPECLPPHVGRIGVYRKFAMFRADMFDLDDTTVLLPRSQVRRVDANGKYAVCVVDWHGAPHEFQLPMLSKELYRVLVREWALTEGTFANKRGASAVNDRVLDPAKDGPRRILGELVEDGSLAAMKARADLDARRRSALRRIAASVGRGYERCAIVYRRAREAYLEAERFLFPPEPPPPPELHTVDVRAKTDACMFLKIVAAEGLLAMDAGGTSDPFATARWGSLECKTEVVYETTSPIWDETFVFNLGTSTSDVIEEDVNLCLYDYDLALNDFLGFCRVDLRGKRLSQPGDWSKEPRWYNVGALPADYEEKSGFDWGRLKDQLMFWEGKRTYTGRVKIACWVGSRTDLEMRTAEHPRAWRAAEASRSEPKYYVEPLTAALHVTVFRAREILPMDGSRDDPGGLSDPYCEVTMEHEKTARFETEQTHFIDDTDSPEWDRKFSFVVSRPYTASTLWFKVYDYDGGFDQLIGTVKIKCEDLDIHEGLAKPPPAKWYTLLDASGKDKTKDGDPYGDVLIQAYIDEEYLHHMHLQKVRVSDEPDLGRLEVDVFKLHELDDGIKDVFVVIKYGPYWSTLPTIEDADDARYDLRSIFPVIDFHVPVVIAAFAGVGDAPKLLGKIKVPVAALESNQRYFKVVDMGAVNAATGEVEKGGKLDVALTYRRDAGTIASGVTLARQYVKPVCDDKWYYNPIPETEQEKVAKRHKDLVIYQLGLSEPPVNVSIAKEMLDYNRHEFNARMIQTSIARLQCVAAEGIAIGNAVNDLLGWKHFHVTASLQAVLFLMINYPRLIIPGILILIGSIPLALYPTRRKRALDQISMDYDVSVGKLPPHLDILLNGDSLTNEEVKAREREQKEREAADKKAEEARLRAESEAAAQRAEEEAEAIAAILAEADAESEADSDNDDAAQQAPKMAGSMNPFASLMKQYEELTTMIASIQTTMDDVATVLEQILGVLTWKEPRVTFVAMAALVGTGLAFFVSQFVVEWTLFVVWLVGKKAVGATSGAASSASADAWAKAVDFISECWEYLWDNYIEGPYTWAAYTVTVTMATTTNSVMYAWSFVTLTRVFKATRFVVSLCVLYELRHPAVFPDARTEFKKASGTASRDDAGADEKRRQLSGGDVNDEANKAAHANDGKEIGTGKKGDPGDRKKSDAEAEAEAERERRRAARAKKKAERKRQKEIEDAAKRARAEGTEVIDNRPLAPLNALFRIPSKSYRIL